jgi:flagellar protein FliS
MAEGYNAYQAAQAYRGASVAVPPLKAVVMLFDEAITLLKKAIEAGAAKRFEESHGHVLRTTAVLRGLSFHLNAEKGGALAAQLFTTYNSLILACLRSFGQPDAESRYHRLIFSLTELRDAWSGVLASDAAQTAKS